MKMVRLILAFLGRDMTHDHIRSYARHSPWIWETPSEKIDETARIVVSTPSHNLRR